jgi:hypothetical protein
MYNVLLLILIRPIRAPITVLQHFVVVASVEIGQMVLKVRALQSHCWYGPIVLLIIGPNIIL